MSLAIATQLETPSECVSRRVVISGSTDGGGRGCGHIGAQELSTNKRVARTDLGGTLDSQSVLLSGRRYSADLVSRV